jgi:zinc protease
MKNLNKVAMSSIPEAAPAKESDAFPKAVAIRKTRVHIVNKPSVSQTSFMVGKSIDAGEGAPQRHALLLANYAFGGGNFSSRLLNALRSDQGKTYSISSHIDLNRTFGTFIASATTQHHQLTPMLRIFFDEFARLRDNGITHEELKTAKKYAIGSMAFQLEGIGNIAEKLLWLRLHNRPDSYIETYADRINDFSLDYVNQAIAQHFGAGAFIVATCGEKSQIYEGLKEFGQVHTSSLNSSIK